MGKGKKKIGIERMVQEGIKRSLSLLRRPRARKVCFSVLLLVIILIGAFGSYSMAYAEKSYPHIMIGEVAVGGLTKSDIEKKLVKPMKMAEETGLQLVYGNKTWDISPEAIKLRYDAKKNCG